MNKTAWLFPGQASQKVGMGKDIYDKIPSAKEYFDIETNFWYLEGLDNALRRGKNLCLASSS